MTSACTRGRRCSSSETDVDPLPWSPTAAISEREIGEDMKMILRFVVVPAIPTETGSTRSGARFYCETAPIGFNIYDNEEKLRLKSVYQTRAEAESACVELNQVRLQGMLSGRESMPSL
jgi:hypothetical protein